MAEKILNIKDLKFRSQDQAVTTRYEVAHVDRIKRLIKCPKIDSAIREQLKKYLRLRYQDGNTFGVEYLYSKTSPDCRLYARQLVGGQGFKRPVRCYIMEGKYKDFGLANCFPALTLQLSETKKIGKCAALENYVKNRETVLAELKMEKKKVLEILNTSYKKPEDEGLLEMHDFIYDKFVTAFKKDPQFAKLWEITKKAKDHNEAGSFYSKVLQHYENQILHAMDDYLEENGFETDANVLVFDGIQVLEREGQQVDLRELEKHIKEETGFDMTVCEKPMEVDTEWLKKHDLEPLPIKEKSAQEEEEEDEKGALFRNKLYDDAALDNLAKEAIMFRTHQAVARFLTLLWHDQFYYHDEEWWFFDNHHWQTDNGAHFSYRMLSDLMPLLLEKTAWSSPKTDKDLCGMLKKLNSQIGTASFYRNVTSTAALYFARKDFAEFDRRLEQNLNLLCFKNGVYDLDKCGQGNAL